MFAAAGTEQENVHAMQPEWEVAKPCRSHESPRYCKGEVNQSLSFRGTAKRSARNP
jgi:hypothetical protein